MIADWNNGNQGNEEGAQIAHGVGASGVNRESEGRPLGEGNICAES